MRRAALSSLLAVVLLLAAVPSHAWSRHDHFRHPGVRTHVFIGVGPGFWWGAPYPYWWYAPYPYWWYPPPYYGYAAPVVVQEPEVYIQQPQVYIQQPPAEPQAPQAYWYYCPSAKAYYPNVQTCAEPWVKVPPRPE